MIRGAVLKTEVYERTQKASHFQQHFKLILKSVFNEVFTFITLQTKTLIKRGNVFLHHYIPEHCHTDQNKILLRNSAQISHSLFGNFAEFNV